MGKRWQKMTIIENRKQYEAQENKCCISIQEGLKKGKRAESINVLLVFRERWRVGKWANNKKKCDIR